MRLCTNAGTIDRVIRAVIGIGAIVLAFTMLGVMTGAVAGIVATVIGVIMLATAASGICPMYVPFGISTCGAAKR